MSLVRHVVIAACGLASAFGAHAHIVLEQKSAPAGSYYKAVFMVGHGCAGSATRGVEVRVPDGVQGAHPQPKAGWQVETVREKLTVPLTSHGKTVNEDVRLIRWAGGTLADAHFDEFVLLAKLPEQAGSLVFPVTQQCDEGKAEWKPALQVVPKAEPLAAPAAASGASGDHAHHHQ
jgi:uncharacterized protein YcnI